jgi:DNA polymerase I-like protein with 3'-5' exonuclease and polymerase domains
LAKLKAALLTHWKGNEREFIRGLDGRKVMTRTEHSVLNSLFQSGGIICMKKAMVLWDQWVREEGLNAAQVIHYHDEAQAEVKMSDIEFKKFDTQEEADLFTDETKIWSGVIKSDKGFFRAYCRAGELGVKSIREAGVQLGLNVQLDAEYMVGRSWRDTH